MKKLIGMTDFVEEIQSEISEATSQVEVWQTKIHGFDLILKQKNSLKLTPTIGMFVPCDENGNVLEEPLNYKYWVKKSLNVMYDLDLIKYEIYQKSLSKVIFKGFVYNFEIQHCGNGSVNFTEEFLQGKTIEDLVPYNLERV